MGSVTLYPDHTAPVYYVLRCKEIETYYHPKPAGEESFDIKISEPYISSTHVHERCPHL